MAGLDFDCAVEMGLKPYYGTRKSFGVVFSHGLGSFLGVLADFIGIGVGFI